MSIFSSNLNVLQAWNSCLGVLPILEYCHLNLFCNAGQSSSNRASDSYHSLTSPISVMQKHLTFSPSGKLCASIQSLVLRRGYSASSSDLPENSGFLPILINYLGSGHYHTSRDWLYWKWLWWWLNW